MRVRVRKHRRASILRDKKHAQIFYKINQEPVFNSMDRSYKITLSSIQINL